MPNGRRGDHPYTDVLNHGSSEFGEPVDSLVKELAKLPRFSEVAIEVSSILEENSPLGSNNTLERKAAALAKLKNIKQRLLSSTK